MGIFCFFAITFIGNIILGILNLSSAFNEVVLLYCLFLVLILLRVVYLDSLKKRLAVSATILICILIVLYLPEKAFWSRPIVLTDEIALWHPMTSNYFNNGLAYSMLHRLSQGYGLFIPHIFVTLKRLALFNKWSISTYAFMPNVIFLISLLFLIEIRIKKFPKILLVSLFVLYVFVQRWVALLLCDSLMSDGIASLMFAIVLKEALALTEDGACFKNMSLFFVFWFLAGALGLTKPFISMFCFLIPFILLRNTGSSGNKLKLVIRFLLAVTFMAICFVLWAIISKKLGIDRLVAYKPKVINYFNPAVLPEMLRFWITDRYFIPLFLLVSGGLILGINKSNRFPILVSSAFIIFNLVLIFGIYVFYGKGWEIESSYRFLVQMLLVSFFALGLSLDAIASNSKMRDFL